MKQTQEDNRIGTARDSDEVAASDRMLFRDEDANSQAAEQQDQGGGDSGAAPPPAGENLPKESETEKRKRALADFVFFFLLAHACAISCVVQGSAMQLMSCYSIVLL